MSKTSITAEGFISEQQNVDHVKSHLVHAFRHFTTREPFPMAQIEKRVRIKVEVEECQDNDVPRRTD